MMELSKRITRAREFAELNVTQASKFLSVEVSEFESWESGESEPSLEQISQMCDVFQVSSDFLLLGKDNEGIYEEVCCPFCGAKMKRSDSVCSSCGEKVTPIKQSDFGKTYTLILTTNQKYRDLAARRIKAFFLSKEFYGDCTLEDGRLCNDLTKRELEQEGDRIAQSVKSCQPTMLCRNISYKKKQNVVGILHGVVDVFVFYEKSNAEVQELWQTEPVDRYMIDSNTASEAKEDTLGSKKPDVLASNENKSVPNYGSKPQKKGQEDTISKSMSKAENAPAVTPLVKKKSLELKNKIPKTALFILAGVVGIAVVAVLVGNILIHFGIFPGVGDDYEEALSLFNAGNYVDAAGAFEKLGNVKDSKDRYKESAYLAAQTYIKNKSYEEARAFLENLEDDYYNVADLKTYCDFQIECQAIEDLCSQGDYEQAYQKTLNQPACSETSNLLWKIIDEDSVNLVELEDDYDNNEVSADNKYKNKFFIIAGQVQGTDTSLLGGENYLEIEVGSSLDEAHCYDLSQSELMSFNTGDNAIIAGYFEANYGWIGIDFRKCSVVDSEYLDASNSIKETLDISNALLQSANTSPSYDSTSTNGTEKASQSNQTSNNAAVDNQTPPTSNAETSEKSPAFTTGTYGTNPGVEITVNGNTVEYLVGLEYGDGTLDMFEGTAPLSNQIEFSGEDNRLNIVTGKIYCLGDNTIAVEVTTNEYNDVRGYDLDINYTELERTSDTANWMPPSESEAQSQAPQTSVESVDSGYPIDVDMNDLMTADILGDTFWSAYEGGWLEEWMGLYINGNSGPSPYNTFWFSDSLGEWTYYGITYSEASSAGWGDVWMEIMQSNGYA